LAVFDPVFPFTGRFAQAFAGLGDVGGGIIERGEVLQICIFYPQLCPAVPRAAVQIRDGVQMGIQNGDPGAECAILEFILDTNVRHERHAIAKIAIPSTRDCR
jgi:hypothetical protein